MWLFVSREMLNDTASTPQVFYLDPNLVALVIGKTNLELIQNTD